MTHWKDIHLDTILNADFVAPGEGQKYQRIMQHRTNEAMNGLSHRLDKILSQAEKDGKAQGRQQAVMIALTAVLAISTVAYTVTTVWSTLKTVAGQQTVYVSGIGAVPESAAVHMGFDETGRAAVCINGTAHNPPTGNATTIEARYPDLRNKAGDAPAPVAALRCVK
ncbi:hypothetical protein [Pandoraea apista]|uniref:hypothetical protein n=1 Tax=Pandoraea apista TaxID=93218 RepID=UPI0006583D68|nr:hypothetical protein [Pandoraea apista]ALS68364.1 hypothetical protein AT395_24775 [Pandoraea apista]ALS68426.1 hypothetical protein AT395_25125 [Pandoraea apista]CFB60454.1 hypothetical protein LMG16407_00493 [Pandoraea apista]